MIVSSALLACVHPETLDGRGAVLSGKRENFPKVQDIKHLRGGVDFYAA